MKTSLHSLAAAVLLAVAALGWAGTGCIGTVHQHAVESHSAGFYVPPVKQPDGAYLVDDAFRDRFNALIATYGHKRLENGAPVFTPPLEKDYGVTPAGAGHWRMTADAIEQMAVMVSLKRRGAAP